MLLGSALAWARPQNQGNRWFPAELRSLDYFFKSPNLVGWRLPAVRSMNIDHHENVCARPEHGSRVHRQRCRGKKTFIKHYSLNRANRELETENKRTTARRNSKEIFEIFLAFLFDIQPRRFRRCTNRFGLLLPLDETFLQKRQKRSYFRVTSKHENCSRLISSPTSLRPAFLCFSCAQKCW